MRENLDKAAYYRPSNLTAIIDVNRLGQRGPTKLEGDTTGLVELRRVDGERRGAAGVLAVAVRRSETAR